MFWFVLLLRTLDVQGNTLTTEMELSSPLPRTFDLNNEVTYLAPSLRYTSDHKDTYLWVENGKNSQILNLNSLGGVSSENADHFANVSVVKLPKCCPHNSVLAANDCENDISVPFAPRFKVYEHNQTHFWNESLDVSTLKFEPYYSSFNCSSGTFSLDQNEEEFAILMNGSLLVRGYVSGILSGANFCVENVESSNGTFDMQVFLCAPDERIISTALYITYVIFTIISSICFALTFCVYFFWLKIQDIHRKFFTGYVFAMTMTFLSLTVVKTTTLEENGCRVLGFLFQLFVTTSFTMLGILCAYMYITVKYIDDSSRRKKGRFWYLTVPLGVPFLSLIISLSRLTPDVPNSFFKPQHRRNYCFFNGQSTTLFHVTAGISIVVCIVCLVMTKLKIVRSDQTCQNDFFWLEKRTLCKLMWQKHLVMVLISLTWFIGTLTRLNSSLIDLVEASQGILVFLLFVVDKKTRTQIIEDIEKRKRKRNSFRRNMIEEEFLMN